MKRWDSRVDRYIDSPSRIEKFLDAYAALCEEHRLTLSQQDQGAFIVEELGGGPPDNIEWVRQAVIGQSYVDETKGGGK